MKQQDARRAKLVRLIHVARRELALDEDAYRDVLQVATAAPDRPGKRSSSEMSVLELNKVLQHLKKCGFKVNAPRRAGSRALADDPQDKLIRHLWLSLHAAGAVRDSSEGALSRWVRRETGVEALQWLDAQQASKCIEKLKKWMERL